MMVETLQQLLPGFLIPYFNAMMQLGQDTFGANWADIVTVVWTVIKVMLIIAPLLLVVAYTTFWERKVIGWMQVRIGPNRVGPWGLIQPLADGLKIMLKEPERVARLQENGQTFLRLAQEAGLDTGTSRGFAIVPVITER